MPDPCDNDVRDGDFGFYLGRREEDGEKGRHGEGSGQKDGWQKNGGIGRRWDDIFLPSMFLPDLVQPLQGWRLARDR